MTKTLPSARDTATLLLETLPHSMRILGGALLWGRAGDAPALNMGQLRMLEMLHRHPWTLGDLAERHHVSASTMSRTVDVLVKRSWVDRRSHPEDRRQVLLSLTENGETAHRELRRHAEDGITALVEQLSDDERARLYDGLHILQQLATRAATQGFPCERPKE